MIFVPLTSVAMGTLPQAEIGNASGIFNLMRNVGGSIGISAVTTMLMRDAQAHQAGMVAHMTPRDITFALRSRDLTQFMQGHFSQADASLRAQAVLYGEMQRQAVLWAFVNNFRMLALICLGCAGSVLLLKKVSRNKTLPGE